MKKILGLALIAGMFAFTACGPSAEEKQAAEKAMQDSIAQAEQASSAMQEQAQMQDSANAAPAENMTADSTAK